MSKTIDLSGSASTPSPRLPSAEVGAVLAGAETVDVLNSGKRRIVIGPAPHSKAPGDREGLTLGSALDQVKVPAANRQPAIQSVPVAVVERPNFARLARLLDLSLV